MSFLHSALHSMQPAPRTVETRACTSRPRCGILSCDDLWSAWTPCPTLCLGGTEARTFDFSTLLGNSSDFENDTNARVQLGSGRMIDTLTIESFSMMACAVSFGEVQNRSCDDGEGVNCSVDDNFQTKIGRLLVYWFCEIVCVCANCSEVHVCIANPLLPHSCPYY